MSLEEEVIKAHSRLRAQKEQFVSGLTGGSLSEINTVTLVGLVSLSENQGLIPVCIRVMGCLANENES